MKKLYICLWLALWLPARLLAQVSDPTRATLDNLFAPLDKSQVPTGFLAEDALPLVPLDIFNGTLTDSSRTSPDGFRYLYATLFSARVYGTQPLLTLQAYNNRTAAAIAAAGPSTIPLMVARVGYATVRPDAFSQNLLAYSNGQVRDVAGRTQSPYLVRTAFAAAPTSSSSATGTVSLVLSSTLEVRSGGPPISNRYLDFGDGRGYLLATSDQPLTASYTTTGPKRIKVRYTYSDTSSLESWFDITVTHVTNNPAATSGAPSGSVSGPLAGYDPIIAPIPGVRAGGTAYFQLGAGHTGFTKPLIVAEGFDPSSIAPLIQENLSLVDFQAATEGPTSNFFFFDQLIRAGYDIIYIDYKNGTDDVLLNAALFEEVLNRVNANKVGTEQNVVLGISMGGLVARYQLADMVKNNRPTQTRLLILQDSPQRGANVPLGIQALLRQADISFGSFRLRNAFQILDQALLLLDQPATQQLLLYRATDASSGFAANTFIEGAYRQKVTFAAGQAPPYRIVATSQGSQCGNQLFSPYAELIRGDANTFLSPFPWIKRQSYHAQLIVNALPANQQSSRISTAQFYTVLHLFGFVNIRTDFVREDYSCPSGLLAVDGVAGGTQYVGARLDPNLLPAPRHNSFGPFFEFNLGYSFVREFCFVPTASALDLADFDQTSFTGKFINSVASTSTSRTDGFIAQESFVDGTATYYNQFHTVFTPRNSEWMFNEMQRPVNGNTNPIGCDPNPECSALSPILGPSQVCASGTSVFTINTSNVTWSATPTNYFTTTSGSGSQFSTSALSGVRGTGTITATPSCGPPVTRTVSVGPAEPTGTYYFGGTQPLQTVNSISSLTRINMALNGSNSFTFTSSSPSVPVTSFDGVTAYFDMPAEGVTITATATNSTCGLEGHFAFTYTGGYTYFAYSPNPAGSDLTVTATDPAHADPFDADLFDTHGQKVKSQHGDHGKAVLDVRELPNGLYNLRVGHGKHTLSAHIQVTH